MKDNSGYNEFTIVTAYSDLKDEITIRKSDLPSDAISWPQYDFAKWETEIFPLVRNDEQFHHMVRSAVTEYLISAMQEEPLKAGSIILPPGKWDIWDGKPPWQFETGEYWDEIISQKADDYLGDSDDLIAQNLREYLDKFADDDMEAYRIHSALEALFEPSQKSADYFKIIHSCHWISVPVARAIQLLRPSHDIKILETYIHSCVVDLTECEVFDILHDDNWEERSIEFALHERSKPVDPAPAPVRH